MKKKAKKNLLETPVFKNNLKEYPVNYRLIRLTLRHMKDRKVIWSSLQITQNWRNG